MYRTLSICASLFLFLTPGSAQTPTENTADAPHVFIRGFTNPVYPDEARIAGIKGDVTLTVAVRADGSLESVTPGTGDPQLMQAALESLKKSQFECRACGASSSSREFTYSFTVSPEKPDPCCCSSPSPNRTCRPTAQSQSPPAVLLSDDHITVTEPPLCMCPDECSRKWAEEQSHVRSAKCLWLWKCGRHQVYIH